ncbi:MAG: flagellar hook-length control protein [Dokdonella sp.]|nr:MAG: flagellar hook-length control protein [Dokdonella sp.]
MQAILCGLLLAWSAVMPAVQLAVETPTVVPGKKGMTWGVATLPNPQPGLVLVSCHGQPRIGGAGCDAYEGDTLCSAALPVLCVSDDRWPLPPALEGATNFHRGWARGRVALTPPVRGDALTSPRQADAQCVAEFGAGWRMAEHHDGGGGWSYLAAGSLGTASRFWVAINDTAGNCWGSAPSYRTKIH